MMGELVTFSTSGNCPACDAPFDLSQSKLVCAKCGCDLTAVATVLGLPALAYNRALELLERRDAAGASMLLAGALAFVGEDESCRSLLCHIHALAGSAEAPALLARLPTKGAYRMAVVAAVRSARRPAAGGTPAPSAASPAGSSQGSAPRQEAGIPAPSPDSKRSPAEPGGS